MVVAQGVYSVNNISLFTLRLNFTSLFLVDSDDFKQNVQAEKLRRLENENDDIGSHAFSTYLYVVHHYRASRSS